MKVISVLNLQQDIERCGSTAQFDRGFDEDLARNLIKLGLAEARHFACAGMGWIWRQWLAGASKPTISRRVGPLIERGLEMRKRAQWYDFQLTLHDMLLLCCAIFASDENQLRRVAEQVADANGDKGQTPHDNGELYASAWSGLLKHSVLGDDEKALQQSELIWSAYRDAEVRGAPKPLVMPWLKKDWKAFIKQQQRDFDKRWASARKDGWTVRSESQQRTIVTTSKYQIEHQWCWAHCAMAMLAHRQGVKVVTDSFWFPPQALEDTQPNPHANQSANSQEQQDLF